MLLGLWTAAAAEPEPALESLRERLKQPELSVGALVIVHGAAETQPEGDETSGLSMRAVRLSAMGTLDHGVRYSLLVDLVAAPILLDAVAGWAHRDGWVAITAGRGRLPFSGELLTLLPSIDFANRSRVLRLYGPDRDLGVTLSGTRSGFDWALGAFNGNETRGGGGNDDRRFLGSGRLGWSGELGEGRRVALYGSAAASNDRAAPWGDGPGPFFGTRVLWGADLRVQVDRLLVAGEVLGGGLDEATEEPRRIVGGYATVGVDLPADFQALVRLDSLAEDVGNAPTSHLGIVGLNWRPTDAVLLRLNVLQPLSAGFGDLQGKVAAQVAF